MLIAFGLPRPAPCSPSASLHEVLDKIVANRLHRWGAKPRTLHWVM